MSRLLHLSLLIGAAVVSASVNVGTVPATAGIRNLVVDPMIGHQALHTGAGRLPQWEHSLARHQRSRGSTEWRRVLAGVDGYHGRSLLSTVNASINRARYVPDSQNWGQADYWASPYELLTRGGDCEDFAIAKYLLLREMGMPASRLRILVLRGGVRQVEHSVLAVTTGEGVVVLDNQRSDVYLINSDIARNTVYSLSGHSMWVNAGLPNVR